MSDLIDRQAAINAPVRMVSEGIEWIPVYHVEQLPSAQPEQQNARIFQGIIVEYPTISTYPECKGKPYFSIKYTENGQEFIGYGTYKPEALSEYLKEYFMPSAQTEHLVKESGNLVNGLVNDCISRQAAIDILYNFAGCIVDTPNGDYRKAYEASRYKLETLPSAQTERKKEDE